MRVITAFLLLAAATFARADGAATFKAKCALCHGQEGKGGAMFKQPIQGQKEAVVLKMIKEGRGKMKPVQLSEEDAKAVATYVAGLKK